MHATVTPHRSRTTRAGLAAAACAALLLGGVAPAGASVATTPDTTDKVAGTVYAIATQDADSDPATPGSDAYVGGLFTAVGGQTRGNVALIGADGRTDRTFLTSTDGKVQALALSADGTTLFIGGTFTQVNGAPRANLAAVDAVTGELRQGWVADTGGTRPDVTSLALRGDVLYVGGRFGAIDGIGRKRLVAVGATSGDVVRAFNPSPNAGVREVVVGPDGTVFAGGAFTAMGQQPRLAAAAVDGTTGAATAFNPSGQGGNAVTVGVSPDGTRFFVTTENNVLFAYDHLTSNDPVWTVKTSGNTQAMAVTEDEMWIGGHFSQIVTGKVPRTFIASLDPATGSVTEWDPECFGGKLGVWALSHDGDDLHAGGVFSGFGTVKQRGYARFSEVG